MVLADLGRPPPEFVLVIQRKATKVRYCLAPLLRFGLYGGANPPGCSGIGMPDPHANKRIARLQVQIVPRRVGVLGCS